MDKKLKNLTFTALLAAMITVSRHIYVTFL